MTQIDAILTLTHPDGDTLDLFVAQEHNVKHKNKVDVSSIPTFGPSETILTNLEQERTGKISGMVVGRYLANNEAAYSSNYRTAAAEFLTELETWIGNQGSGLTLTARDYDEDITCYIDNITWHSGPPFRNVAWTAEISVGSGIGTSNKRSAPSPSPGSSATINGINIPNPDRVSTTIQTNVSVTPTPFPDSAEDNVLTEDEGVKQRMTIKGTYKKSTTFDSDIRGLLGTGKTYTYSSAFPGVNYTVMVEDFNPDDSADSAATGRSYELKLIRGTT